MGCSFFARKVGLLGRLLLSRPLYYLYPPIFFGLPQSRSRFLYGYNDPSFWHRSARLTPEHKGLGGPFLGRDLPMYGASRGTSDFY